MSRRFWQRHPDLLRAPEVILGHVWSTPIDIWSLGCLIFEFLVGVPFFELYSHAGILFTDIHLARVLEHIGPFPPGFLAACSRRAEYFNENGSLLRIQGYNPRSIEDCFRQFKVLDEDAILSTSAFMRRCLIVDPALRPSALELVKVDWLNDV